VAARAARAARTEPCLLAVAAGAATPPVAVQVPAVAAGSAPRAGAEAVTALAAAARADPVPPRSPVPSTATATAGRKPGRAGRRVPGEAVPTVGVGQLPGRTERVARRVVQVAAAGEGQGGEHERREETHGERPAAGRAAGVGDPEEGAVAGEERGRDR
jgi:hypothetical protein